jgi:hypothetical protein
MDPDTLRKWEAGRTLPARQREPLKNWLIKSHRYGEAFDLARIYGLSYTEGPLIPSDDRLLDFPFVLQDGTVVVLRLPAILTGLDARRISLYLRGLSH